MPGLAVNTSEMQIAKTAPCGEICTIGPELALTANVGNSQSVLPDFRPFTSEKGTYSKVHLESVT